MPRADLESTTLRLRAGERRVLRAPARSRWTAVHGQVRVTEPPRWLAERVLDIGATLGGGDSHTIAAAGWVTLQALSDCRLVCEGPAPIALRLVAVWRMIRPGRATPAAA